MKKKPAGRTEEQFLNTLAYFDPANFTQDIRCPVVAEIGLMDTVTAAGNQMCRAGPRAEGAAVLDLFAVGDARGRLRRRDLAGSVTRDFLRGEKPILVPTRR